MDEPTAGTFGLVAAVTSGGGVADALGITLDDSLGTAKSNGWSLATAGVSAALAYWPAAEVFLSLSESTYEELQLLK